MFVAHTCSFLLFFIVAFISFLKCRGFEVERKDTDKILRKKKMFKIPRSLWQLPMIISQPPK